MEQTTVIESDGSCMSTEITYKAFGENAAPAVTQAKAALLRLENILSRFIPGSEVSVINKNAGKGYVNISSETFEVLSCASRISEISGGLFDITVGPLIDLWNYKHSFQVPEDEKIRHILSLVNYRDLMLNSDEQSASLRRPEQSIDLGGIGKGYASDCLVKTLQKYGVVSAFVNIGGNVSTLGNKPDGSSWSVGIRHPRHDGYLIGAVKVTGQAVVTSGDYERYFIDGTGKRRHHIINPTTGYPVESGLISVTVVADSAMIADGLSTAIFAADMDKGLGYLTYFPGVDVVLVDNHQRVFITRGLKEIYQTIEGIDVIVI
ncbi:MAG TPA: FAD:protein FMN transferase [Mesotoga sp.]|nr:FAD:protein FMN transferase [Mesotoga sp.]